MGTNIPKQFIPAIKKGFLNMSDKGALSGKLFTVHHHRKLITFYFSLYVTYFSVLSINLSLLLLPCLFIPTLWVA